MATARRAGSVTRRCECRGPDGKRLGENCPAISKRSHGTCQVRQELPPDEGGIRRTFRRTGYTSATAANTDLANIQAILDLSQDDEDAQRRIGDLLAAVGRDRSRIPSPAEVSKKLGVGVPLDGKMTVGQWLDVWFAGKKGTRFTTNAAYRSHIEYHIKPRIGHLRLDKLNVGHLIVMFAAIEEASETIAAENKARREQEARCRWSRPGRPPTAVRAKLAEERERLAAMPPYRKVNQAATWHAIRRTLRIALNAAIAQQLITFNAAAHVELAASKRPQGLLWTAARVERWRESGEVPSAVMVWTPAQLGAFLDAAEDSRLYSFFHMVCHHGQRRGEGVGEGWADVDWVAGTIAVETEIVVDGWVPTETEPKTAGSQDLIKLDRRTLEVLRERKVQQLAERDAWNAYAAAERDAGTKVPDWTDTGKIWTKLDGSWLHPDEVSKEFRRIRDTTDLPPVNLRDCRHGAAGLVKAGGGALEDAKRKLRHRTFTLTVDTYLPLWEEFDAELAERSAAAVPRARKPKTTPEEAPGEQEPAGQADDEDDAETQDGTAA